MAESLFNKTWEEQNSKFLWEKISGRKYTQKEKHLNVQLKVKIYYLLSWNKFWKGTIIYIYIILKYLKILNVCKIEMVSESF